MRVLLFLLLLVSAVGAEEVRRLNLPEGSGPELLPRLMDLFPQGNYTFDAQGNCYVAGEGLDDLVLPADYPVNWESIQLEVRELEPELTTSTLVDAHRRHNELTFVRSSTGRLYVIGPGESIDPPWPEPAPEVAVSEPTPRPTKLTRIDSCWGFEPLTDYYWEPSRQSLCGPFIRIPKYPPGLEQFKSPEDK